MSRPFDSYAAYYDLLYADKDYAGEAAYVDSIIRRHRPNPGSLLELGSGTGAHAVHFGKLGYDVHGIDSSPSMVQRAKARDVSHCPSTPVFEVADLRTFRAGRSFDAVVSLFHVMSYQVGDDDLAAAMKTASGHLSQGGVFVFDCWYGPGVLADPPTSRVRHLSGDGVSIVRTAHPTHDAKTHRVDVRFDIIVERHGDRERIAELHPMRYLFMEEVDSFLEQAGMRRVATTAWGHDDLQNGRPWYACFAAVR